MIFFGTTMTKLVDVRLEDVACPNCGTWDSLQLHIYSKGLQVYFIPTIPIEKICVTGCNECQKTMVYDEMPQQIKELANYGKTFVKPKFSNYLGLIIIVIISALLLLNGIR
jgi:hypothetical protein